MDKLTGPSAPKTGKYVSPFLGEIEVGTTKKIKEGITYTVVGEGKIELTDPDANQTVLATLKRDEAGRQVVTVNSESGFEIVIPLVDFERLAFESGRIGDFIASLTTPVPDDVAAQGPEAEAQFRRLIANGIAPDRAGQIMATPEMQAHVRQLNRIQAAKNLGRPLTKDELLIIAMNEAAFFNAEGILSVPIDCSTAANAGTCSLLAEELATAYARDIERLKQGKSIQNQSDLARQFSDFILACAEADPEVITAFIAQHGEEAFTTLAELGKGAQFNHADPIGYHGDLLISAVSRYIQDDNKAALLSAVAAAGEAFVNIHGKPRAERDRQFRDAIAIALTPGAAAGAIKVGGYTIRLTQAMIACAQNPACLTGMAHDVAIAIGEAASGVTLSSGSTAILGVGASTAARYGNDLLRAVDDVTRQLIRGDEAIPVPAGYRPFNAEAGAGVPAAPPGTRTVRNEATGDIEFVDASGFVYKSREQVEAWQTFDDIPGYSNAEVARLAKDDPSTLADLVRRKSGKLELKGQPAESVAEDKSTVAFISGGSTGRRPRFGENTAGNDTAGKRLADKWKEDLGITNSGYAQFLYHGEAQAILRAHKFGEIRSGQIVSLYTDRKVCSFCNANDPGQGLNLLARRLGTTIEIRTQAGKLHGFPK